MYKLLFLLFGAGVSVVSAAPQTSSDIPSSVPTLKASLSQVNSTHISVALLNDNACDIILLTRDSFIENAVEHRSFSVIPANGGPELRWGVNAVRPWYSRTDIEGSLMTIRAHSSHSKTFDITEVFDVPSAGPYEISFQEAFQGMDASQHPGGKLAMEDLKTIDVESDKVLYSLAASKPMKPVKRGVNAFDHCPQDPQVGQLIGAITVAQKMAKDALLYRPYLFELIFGVRIFQHPTVFNEVDGTYRKMVDYDFNTDDSIHYHCDPDNTIDAPCIENDWLGWYHHASNSIGTCRDFFNLYLSANCVFPNSTTPAVDDQASTILHEFSHVRSFSPQVVDDWPDPNIKGQNCYNYKCATGFAETRHKATLPERSAINFEMFAQLVRYGAQAKICTDKFGYELKPPPTPPTALEADKYQG